MEKILLVANGRVKQQLLKKILSDVDFVIGVDGGTNALSDSGIVPHMVIGDMDSVNKKVLRACRDKGVKIVQYPQEKDETDLELALREAIKMKPGEIVCAGIIGDRPDHTLANLQLLQVPVRKGIFTMGYFDSGVVYCVERFLELKGKPGDTVSLLPLTEEVTGISLKGFKYGLENGKMISGVPLGISNELTDKRGSIKIRSGILLVFHLARLERQS